MQAYDDGNIEALAEPLGMDQIPGMTPEKAKDWLGLTWDHDTVALYGDPAWDVRIAPHACGFEQKLNWISGKDGFNATLEVEAKRDGAVKGVCIFAKASDGLGSQDMSSRRRGFGRSFDRDLCVD